MAAPHRDTNASSNNRWILDDARLETVLHGNFTSINFASNGSNASAAAAQDATTTGDARRVTSSPDGSAGTSRDPQRHEAVSDTWAALRASNDEYEAANPDVVTAVFEPTLESEIRAAPAYHGCSTKNLPPPHMITRQQGATSQQGAVAAPTPLSCPPPIYRSTVPSEPAPVTWTRPQPAPAVHHAHSAPRYAESTELSYSPPAKRVAFADANDSPVSSKNEQPLIAEDLTQYIADCELRAAQREALRARAPTPAPTPRAPSPDMHLFPDLESRYEADRLGNGDIPFCTFPDEQVSIDDEEFFEYIMGIHPDELAGMIGMFNDNFTESDMQEGHYEVRSPSGRWYDPNEQDELDFDWMDEEPDSP